MVLTAINVYSMRDIDESVTGVIDRVASAGYDGIQFSGQHTPLDGDPDAIRRKLNETGLDVPAAHVGILDLENNMNEILSTYEIVGVDGFVVSFLPESNFESVSAVEDTAAKLNDFGDELSGRGLTLHYHNHAHEFDELEDGTTGFEALVERTEVGIELDVGWALYAGVDPADLIERYGHRMDLIHMKDVDVSAARNECCREIGEGDVDMHRCAAEARRVGSEWLVYGHDAPADPIVSVRSGADFLTSV